VVVNHYSFISFKEVVGAEECSSSSAPLPQQNVNPNLLGRREALGFGFSFYFLDVLLQSEAIAAANAAPCELTVAPPGLAFCEKVLGTRPEAVKGQLIKVIYSFIFLF
jgi:peptidylprolyl isomerase